ncbi:isochorismate synthase [Altericroceibacterium spongiae]|uniref:isochorismate synthase n=1 Tax=Altericroceibacterium spongiae TaxID=2320269 RepID=UPI001604732D|nr:isochorismate synthase [Altericroceibacterium spongiae]
MFALYQKERCVETTGIKRKLAIPAVWETEHAVAAHFAAGKDGEETVDASESRIADPAPHSLLVGALPFDRQAAPLLIEPETASWRHGVEALALSAQAPARLPARPVRLTGEPDGPAYARIVAEALRRLDRREGAVLRKVVLARSLHIVMDRPVDPLAIAARLMRDNSVTTFLMDLEEATGLPGHKMVGATPELLVARKGSQVLSHPLAGSAPRSSDPAADRAAADGLLHSEKDQREHSLVVEAIADMLAPYCSALTMPEGTTLRSTASMWHLGTRIEGRLKNGAMPSAAGLAALLHPTPAVGGMPRQAALDCIRELEPQDRGFYAGAVGWTDRAGDGEWYVSLRCAELRDKQLTLHAGAGIVAGSDPQSEVAETWAKFRAILQGLGIEADDSLMEFAA